MKNHLSLYPLDERIYLVKCYYMNDGDVNSVRRWFSLEYHQATEIPSEAVILNAIGLFEKTGNISDIPTEKFLNIHPKKEMVGAPVYTEDDTFLVDNKEDEDEAFGFSVNPLNFTKFMSSVPKIESNETVTKTESISRQDELQRQVTQDHANRKPEKVNKNLWPCRFCNKIFSSSSNRYHHTRLVHPYEHSIYINAPKSGTKNLNQEGITSRTKQQSLRVSKSNISKKPTKKTQPRHTCHICGIGCVRYDTYARHLRTHTGEPGEPSVTCHICGKGFNEKSQLRGHMKKHSHNRPFKCEFPNCSKDFKEKNSFNLHMLIHTGERPHLCEICGKSFKDSSSRIVHYRQHTGENPYTCEICGKKTKQKQNLKSHMRHVHKIMNWNKTETEKSEEKSIQNT